MTSPFSQSKAKVVGVKRQTHDTVTLTLSLSTRDGFAHTPGQFNMIGLRGVGEVPISISSKPGSPGLLEHTIRNVGSVTRVLCGLGKGANLVIRGPYGTGWPMDEAKGGDVVVVAGGIGLAPLRGALLEIVEKRDDYGRLNIVYGARTPEEMLFTDEFEDWKKWTDSRLLLTVDRVGSSTEWKHKTGVVLTLFDNLDTDPYSSTVMTCGPEIMMRFVVRGLIHRGFPPERIYVSMERRMKCGIGHCGHCQLGPKYVCLDGPVFRYVDVGMFPDSII